MDTAAARDEGTPLVEQRRPRSGPGTWPRWNARRANSPKHQPGTAPRRDSPKRARRSLHIPPEAMAAAVACAIKFSPAKRPEILPLTRLEMILHHIPLPNHLRGTLDAVKGRMDARTASCGSAVYRDFCKPIASRGESRSATLSRRQIVDNCACLEGYSLLEIQPRVGKLGHRPSYIRLRLPPELEAAIERAGAGASCEVEPPKLDDEDEAEQQGSLPDRQPAREEVGHHQTAPPGPSEPPIVEVTAEIVPAPAPPRPPRTAAEIVAPPRSAEPPVDIFGRPRPEPRPVGRPNFAVVHPTMTDRFDELGAIRQLLEDRCEAYGCVRDLAAFASRIWRVARTWCLSLPRVLVALTEAADKPPRVGETQERWTVSVLRTEPRSGALPNDVKLRLKAARLPARLPPAPPAPALSEAPPPRRLPSPKPPAPD